MAHVIFYEKPGCAGNARQKAVLQRAGHFVEARDLLCWPWTEEQLLKFFKGLPIHEWFNRSAPAVKSGSIKIQTFSEQTAIGKLLEFPMLIRRPLLQVGQRYEAGFDPPLIREWIGLPDSVQNNLSGCVHTADL